MDENLLNCALTQQDENTLRRIAYQRLAEGNIEDFEALADVMRVFRPGDPVFTLLRLLGLARQGHDEKASQLLTEFSQAYTSAAARTGLDAEARKGIEGAIDAVRSWLPGGKHSSEERRGLRDHAAMFLPRLHPTGGPQ